MITDGRIAVVKGLFVSGKINSLDNLFLFVPQTVIAAYSKVSRNRLKIPGLLEIREIIWLSQLLQVPPAVIFTWCEMVCQQEERMDALSEMDALKIDIIGDRIALGKLQYFSELFFIIPRTSVAAILHLNNDKMASFVNCPGDISVKQAVRMATLFRIKPAIIFQLIYNEIFGKAGLPVLTIKPSIKIIRKNCA